MAAPCPGEPPLFVDSWIDRAHTPPSGSEVDRCHLRVDVVLEANDGSLYGAHASNVEAFSASLLPLDPDPSLLTVSLVKLTEDAEVVSLLCRFAHHRHQPDISSLPWETFCRLSTAVEKYKVYSAIGVCKLKMEYVPCFYFLISLKFANVSDILSWNTRMKYSSMQALQTTMLSGTVP